MQAKLEDKIELREENESNLVWLHYVGRGLYSINTFVREAKKYGVSRAIPLQMLKKLHWGEKIYLAQVKEKLEGGKVVAKVFGYFTIRGINISGSDELKKAVFEDERVNARVVSTGGTYVERACGSYVVSATAVTSADLETVANVISEKAKEFGESVKVFIGGELTLIDPIEIVAPFTRSLVKVELDESKVKITRTLKIKEEDKHIHHVKDYVRRKTLTKKDKIKLYNRSLNEFIGL